MHTDTREENTIDLCTIVIDLNGEAIARGTKNLKWIIDTLTNVLK